MRSHLTLVRAASLRAAALVLLILSTQGCTATKVVLTPVTVVRDIVDAPVASIANVFEFWADNSDPTPTPNVGVGVGLGGVNPGVGLNLNYYLFKPLSWIFGGVDYLVCRSLYPCFAWGISPWKAREDSIGSIYFPNTRYLWLDVEESDEGDSDESVKDSSEVSE